MLYLDLEDPNRVNLTKQQQQRGRGGGGGGGRRAYSLHKEPVGCISPPRSQIWLLAHGAKQRVDGLSKIWSWWEKEIEWEWDADWSVSFWLKKSDGKWQRIDVTLNLLKIVLIFFCNLWIYLDEFLTFMLLVQSITGYNFICSVEEHEFPRWHGNN